MTNCCIPKCARPRTNGDPQRYCFKHYRKLLEVMSRAKDAQLARAATAELATLPKAKL